MVQITQTFSYRHSWNCTICCSANVRIFFL